MDYKFELNEQPKQLVLSIRTRTAVENLPAECKKAYNDIFEYLNELGESPAGVPFAAYYNMDMKDLDVELGFPISKPVPEKDEMKLSEIPAGKQVSCMYKGPYKEICPVYDAMMKWIEENGHSPAGAYEFYYNSPMDVPESELLTKVVFLLR
ncbi:GyrI-like domain-containing protein [Haloimpatiens sp. FM7330]|uniref:GyrI-like domain-containing protein n=1 Tax=Haloimpatiens sp. FM7330 TaxID=3298610 RepID=UPI00362DE139